MMSHDEDRVRAVVWREDALELLDQRLLPVETRYRRLTTAAEVAEAIRDMVVRGAPAIGIAAAYGVVLAARARYAENPDRWRESDSRRSRNGWPPSRPTAVNLFWALRRMEQVIAELIQRSGGTVAGRSAGDSRGGYRRQPAHGSSWARRCWASAARC